MEYYLMMDIDMWLVVPEDFIVPTSEDKKILESKRWTTEKRKKAQLNAKYIGTLECGLTLK